MDNLPERKTSPLEILKALSITDDTWKQAGLEFNSIAWVGEAKTTKSEWDAKRLELENAFDVQEYARNRAEEYPSIVELTIALYDTDDKAAIETKRAAVKTKWPKDNSGPVE